MRLCRRHKAEEKKRVICLTGRLGRHVQGTTHFHLSVSSLTTIFIEAKLQIPALVRDKKRWADRQGSGRRWGPAHRHESGNVIASQQSHQHSLTAHPNNQLRAEDSSLAEAGEKPGSARKDEWIRQGCCEFLCRFFSLTAVSSGSCFYHFMLFVPFSWFRKKKSVIFGNAKQIK